MHETLVWASRALLAVFVAMNLLIVVRKARRDGLDARRRARREKLAPRVLSFLHANGSSIVASLGAPPDRLDREVLEELLLEYARRLEGSSKHRLGWALDELGWVARYRETLAHPSAWRRAEAVEKLGLAGVPHARDSLVSALADESKEVRLRAATALGRLEGWATSIAPLLPAIEGGARWSTIRLADALRGAGERVPEELIAAFPRCERAARLAILEVLGRIRAISACDWLRERLHDTDADVRTRACHALGMIGDPSAGQPVAALLSDPAWPVRAMAARALADLAHASAVPSLCNALGDREWWVRANAARSLRRFGSRGIAALKLMVGDGDRFVAQQAVSALEELGVVDEAIGALAAPRERARKHSVSFLTTLARGGWTSRLREASTRHSDPRVRSELERLLSREGVSS